MTRNTYVVGFLFSNDCTCARQECYRVLLINKKRPEWQAGYLNGVGGKVESGESAEKAMEREFNEETGLILRWQAWTRFATIDSPTAFVYCFWAVAPRAFLDSAKATTDEVPVVKSQGDMGRNFEELLPSVRYLVPLALVHMRGDVTPTSFVYQR